MLNLKLYRKLITFRKFLNTLLRKPYRTSITVLSTGVVTEIQYFKNKQIVKVY
jgi:hypothetical protein